MKRLVGIVLALSLMISSVFAEETTMEKLTNDNAFERTSLFFNTATSNNGEPGEAFAYAIFVAPVAIIESIVWTVVLPFNAIKLKMEED